MKKNLKSQFSILAKTVFDYFYCKSFLAAISLLLIPLMGAASVEILDGSLKRDGRTYFIKGAGGYGSYEELKKIGGNSVRSWGVNENTPLVLDYLERLKMTIAQGLWMAPGRSFDYSNSSRVEKQLQNLLAHVDRLKSYPAVLVWGVGNEVELGAEHDVDMWKALNQAAREIKKIDPSRPTMIVLADFGHKGYKLDYVKKYCPDVDIVGVNTYGGALSVSDRYLQSKLTKPLLVTEFGSVEKQSTPWGDPIEPTSAEKSEHLKAVYESLENENPYYLGSYVFLWGSKREKTDTFFGLLLEGGMKTAMVESVENHWRGKRSVKCPQLHQVSPKFKQAKSGELLNVSYELAAKYTKNLKIKWKLKKELERTYAGKEAKVSAIQDIEMIDSGLGWASFKLPISSGRYRLYLTAIDRKQCAATASIPLLVTP